MKEYKITANDAAQRLDKYLKRQLPLATTGFLYKMLRKKNIVLNHKKASGNELLATGDVVNIYFADETFSQFAGKNTETDAVEQEKSALLNSYQKLADMPILYENTHLLFVNKPAGILTQKAAATDFSVNEWLLGYLLVSKQRSMEDFAAFRPSVLNRLDRNTSGIVICSKTLPGSRILSQMLKERSLSKYYRTIVYGKLHKDQTITAWLSKDTVENQVTILQKPPINTEKSYDRIMTGIHVLASNKDCSYLEIELITGKTHQIRAHLQSIGHPILGDSKYHGESSDKAYGLKHQLLHAYRLEFPQMPEELADLSGKVILYPEPEAFQRMKEKLGF